MKSLSILALVLGLSGPASANDCACKEEYERWKKAKEQVQQLEQQVQNLQKDIQQRQNKILALKNQIANLRMILGILETTMDALFAALSGNPNPVANAGVASAHSQWQGLQANLDFLFLQWDMGMVGNPIQFSTNFWTMMSQTISIAVTVQIADQQGLAAFSGSIGPGGPAMAPPIGPFGALAAQLQNYASHLQKLAQAILDLGVEQLLLDAAKKQLPWLQENLEKARAEEEAARKAYEACLKEHHDGKPCDRAVEIAVPTVKEVSVDLATIDVLSETWLKSATVAPAVSLKK